MRLAHETMEHWPPLAWLAQCDGARVHVRCGRHVERHEGWFAEAAWAGRFQDGDFDRTDIVAGSGGRLRGGELVFVSAGSTVDRLQFWRSGDRVLVSNSLACLLAAAGLDVDPCYGGYYQDFRSIIRGLNAYKRVLETSGGPVHLVYFDNLVWDGSTLERRPKPGAERSFPSFESYRAFLAESMAALAGNLGDHARARPYRSLGTLSSGYDSSTVAVLAQGAGNTEVITFARARGGGEDQGRGVVAALGLEVHVAEREAWQRRPFPEIPFLAANAYGEEVHFSGVGHRLAGRVLFTGFHGDKVWAKDTRHLGPDIVRGDPTGLSLTEYRLWADFLHCPVAFWGVRQIRQLHAISNAPEMRPWDVPGDYSRPICRRIVEEVGVARDQFGVAKRAASVVMWDRAHDPLLAPGSWEDYRAWLRSAAPRWARRGRLPPLLAARLDDGLEAVRRLLDAAPDGVRQAVRKIPVVHRLAKPRAGILFRHLFPWALVRAKARYGAPPPNQ